MFSDGDFVLITQDATLGIIEVKTKVTTSKLCDVLKKLGDNATLSRKGYAVVQPFFGLFVYDCDNLNSKRVLTKIQETFKGPDSNWINILCFGKTNFIRFWDYEPTSPSNKCHKWYSYSLDEMAPAYFIHNVISYCCPNSVLINNHLWFPPEGKEPRKIDEIEMDRSIQTEE